MPFATCGRKEIRKWSHGFQTMDMRAGQAPANEIRPTYGYAGSRGQLTGDEVVGALTQIGREDASVRQRQGPLSCLTWGREGDQLGHRAIVAEELRDPGPHTAEPATDRSTTGECHGECTSLGRWRSRGDGGAADGTSPREGRAEPSRAEPTRSPPPPRC